MRVISPGTTDITRTTLAVFFIATLLVGSFLIVRPFLTSFLWATMIVVATWPILLRLQAWLGRSRGAAVAVMTVLILMMVIMPLLLAVFTIMDKGDDIAERARVLAAAGLPPPPEWVGRIPLAGEKIVSGWQHFIALSRDEIFAQLAPFAKNATRWFAVQAGSVALMLVQFFLMVIISAVLYAKGEAVSKGIRTFAFRLAGEHGEEAAVLAAKAVRGVALGIVVTAIVQSLIGGIGLVVTGVPLAAALTAVMFILCLAQVGPILVMAPAVIWLYWGDGVVWGTVLLAFTLVAQLIDNVVRPVLIKKGVNLSLILILPGVIGGLIAFGIVGLFIGPVVLAVAYTLLKVWAQQEKPGAAPVESSSGDG